MSNENRKRAARSGWARRRGEAPQRPSETEPDPAAGAPDGGGERPTDGAAAADREPLFAAYRAAKARHDEAIAALKRATRARAQPDAELVRAQAEAALEEFDALTALRAGVRA